MRIYGFETFNPLKVLYTATHLGLDFEYIKLNPTKGEHKAPDYMKIHPLGKVPALEHNGKYLFESGAICRYLANISESSLYPKEHFRRALVDQWMDYFTAHLGRWLGAVYFERVIRPMANLGEPNQGSIDEALEFIQQQAQVVDNALSGNSYLLGEEISVADYFGFAYFETTEQSNVEVDQFPHVQDWFRRINRSSAVKYVREQCI